jgi:hypothetical protein
MNRNFGKLNEGAIEYAPDTLTIEGRKVYNPKAVHYRIAGYLPVDTAFPSNPPSEGYHWVADGWEECYGAIRSVWREEANPPPPPRRWTRLSIKTALAKAGILPPVYGFLQTVEIANGYMAWEALSDCDYVEEGYPDAEKWNALLDGAAQALGKTREEIDAFLASIPTEG